MKNQAIDFNYLRPPISLKEIIHSERYKKHGEGKKAIRKIFHYTNYDDFEMKNLLEFEDLINKELIDVPFPKWWTRADTLRYAYAEKFDLKKGLKTLRAHLEWHQDPRIFNIEDASKKYLTDGVFYQYGRDKQLRPIIIINSPLDVFLMGLSHLLIMVERMMFYPGKIENWVTLIDTNAMGLFNFPFKILKKIVDITSANFSSRLDKLYILNPSFSLNASWNIISGMLDPETADKINFLKKANYHQLQQNIDSDQLQQKYGGIQPNLTEFWPPINTLKEPPYIPQDQEQNVHVSPGLGNGVSPAVEVDKKEYKRNSILMNESKPRVQANIPDYHQKLNLIDSKTKIDVRAESKLKLEANNPEEGSIVLSKTIKKAEFPHKKLDPIAESTTQISKNNNSTQRLFRINPSNSRTFRALSSTPKQLSTTNGEDKHDDARILHDSQIILGIQNEMVAQAIDPMNNNNNTNTIDKVIRKNDGASEEPKNTLSGVNVNNMKDIKNIEMLNSINIPNQLNNNLKSSESNDEQNIQVDLISEQGYCDGIDYDERNKKYKKLHVYQNNNYNANQKEYNYSDSKTNLNDLESFGNSNGNNDNHIHYEGENHSIEPSRFCGVFMCKTKKTSNRNLNNEPSSYCNIF